MLLNKCSSTREPMETSAWVLTSLDSRTDKNCNGKKCLLSMLFINAVFIIVFFWYENKPIRWHYESRLRCRQEMLYDKPQIFKPPRSDVLMVTPWLAPIIWNGSYNIDILNAQFHQRNVRVGITVFAMKKYTVFIKTFIETAEQFFMVGHKVNYYVFTDRADDISNFTLPEGRQLVILEVPSYKQWQEVSMRRMEMIRDKANQRFYKEVDYLVCVDVDMRFSDFVGVEILSDVFGTIHPGFYNAQRGSFTYERRQKSTAYIPTDEGDFYYAGGYFGGTVEEVYKLTNFCHKAIMTDKHNSIEAIWHDESHLNKYFLYHKPTRILSPEYLWDNNFGVPQFLKRRRFVAVPKNHNEIRNKRAL
ncbi:histo-blood group ABO system transferase-like isoform X2 [Rana temporaria]|uniref:histo-blood group ABO system transferase-like isoform X2 n=1 Tax=Rana temporaria TaxID=8407 RepID=UPI001AACBCB8|nr:histo-blood group ABO system transferase-like isoform X2 [Rana temporaria]